MDTKGRYPDTLDKVHADLEDSIMVRLRLLSFGGMYSPWIMRHADGKRIRKDYKVLRAYNMMIGERGRCGLFACTIEVLWTITVLGPLFYVLFGRRERTVNMLNLPHSGKPWYLSFWCMFFVYYPLVLVALQVIGACRLGGLGYDLTSFIELWWNDVYYSFCVFSMD